MAIITLRFNDGSPYELLDTEFSNKAGNGVSAGRGMWKTSSFGWTNGAKALALLLVDYKLWGQHSDPAAFEFRGRVGSPAASMDAALGKRSTNIWLQNIFGPVEEGRDWPFSRLVIRTNPDGKRKSAPFGLRFVAARLPPDQIDIYLGARRLEKTTELEELLQSLKSQWTRKPNETLAPVPSLPAASITSGTGDVLAGFSEHLRRWTTTRPAQMPPLAFRGLSSNSACFRRDYEAANKVLLFSAAEVAQHLPCTRSSASLAAERLRTSGWCSVASTGATGKTTLAAQLAVEGSVCPGPTFYVSLGAQEGRADALMAALAYLSKEPVLLVLDDVHLAPQLAEQLFSAWESAAPQAKLLLLGREIWPGPNPQPHDRFLARFNHEALKLEFTADEIPKLLRSQLRRLQRALPENTELPAATVRRWHRLFSADVLCFAQAVAARAEMLQQGDFELWPDDADALVRQRYLQQFHADEQAELLRLAVFSAIAVDVSEHALDTGRLRTATQLGVVHQLAAEWGTIVRINHPGLAELLLECALPAPDRAVLFVEVAERFPAFALMALQQMECQSDLPVEQQPFAGKWTVGDLLRSPAVRAWVEKRQLSEVMKMIREYPRRGFQHDLIHREFAKLPNTWPNHPFRSLLLKKPQQPKAGKLQAATRRRK